MTSHTILVTGGAGYIGSHTVHQLLAAGHRVVVLDNLYSGHRWAVPAAAEFVEGSVADPALIRATLEQHAIDSVIHFAAHIVVPESVADPVKYYRNNTVGSLNLIAACADAGVTRFVFSSTAAVYGLPERVPVAEDAPTVPINPYGASKLMTERLLADVAAATGLRYLALRYFNVAGAQLAGDLGQATPAATHLIKVACEAACGKRSEVTIFGTDYATADGTGVRDYIHVEDLARAHLAALDYLAAGGTPTALNCGYGRGYSVREVLDTVKAVSGVDFPVREAPRRAGDPDRLIADNARILATLDWRPRHDDLAVICRTAYQWEQRLQASAPGAAP